MIKLGDKIENARTGQRMIFLKTWAETNGTQLQIECFSPLTDAREPEHIHPYQENRFHVLSGELSFFVDGNVKVVHPGETLSIPKNTPHFFWNSGRDEAHYIQEFFPALKIDSLFETFFALARDKKLNKGGAPNIFMASLIMLKYEKELRLSKPAWILQKIAFNLFAPIGRLLAYKPDYQ